MKQSQDIQVPVSLLKEGDMYIAYSPAFDLSTTGITIKQARERFDEAIAMFLEEIIQAGTLDDVLLSLGWQKQKQRWHPPQMISIKQQKVHVSQLT